MAFYFSGNDNRAGLWCSTPPLFSAHVVWQKESQAKLNADKYQIEGSLFGLDWTGDRGSGIGYRGYGKWDLVSLGPGNLGWWHTYLVGSIVFPAYLLSTSYLL